MISPNNDDVQKSSMESIQLVEINQSPQHTLAQQNEAYTLAPQKREGQENVEMMYAENDSSSSQQAFDRQRSDRMSNQYDVEAANREQISKEEEGEETRRDLPLDVEAAGLPNTSLNTEEQQRQQDDEEQVREVIETPEQRVTKDEKFKRAIKKINFDDLFFDLLLTACLSVYSNNIDLSSASNYGIFIGYFSLLWWSWWSQTLYDVRYRRREDYGFRMKCLQRLIRITCLGVWVAFATVSSEFARGRYRNLSIIYVCSRGTLIADYLVALIRTFLHPTAFYDEEDISFAAKQRQDVRISERQCHLISIGTTIPSIILWTVSQYFIEFGYLGFPRAVIGMWIVGIVIELIGEVVVEIYGPLRSISATPIVERLTTFSLMVFGSGFENIGQALNLISPANRDYSRKNDKPVGGWSRLTVLNAIASMIIVTLLYLSYYPEANKEFVAHPGRIITWCYIHIILHIASAVLMIGFGKVISYINTLTALRRFGADPTSYLPPDEGWQNFLNYSSPNQVLYNGTIPVPGDIQDYYERTLVEIAATITSLQGAADPNVTLAQALANSTIPFKNYEMPAAAKTAIGNYANVISAMQQPDSLNRYLSQNASSFYYVYVCPAIYMFGNFALKLIRHSSDGWRSIKRPIVISQSIRLIFGTILILVQVGFLIVIHRSDAKTLAVECGLIILACILMLETFIQIAIEEKISPSKLKQEFQRYYEAFKRWRKS